MYIWTRVANNLWTHESVIMLFTKTPKLHSVSAWTVRHESTCIISFRTRHAESINDDKNDDIHTLIPSFTLSLHVLLMTSQSIGNDATNALRDATIVTRKAISNLFSRPYLWPVAQRNWVFACMTYSHCTRQPLQGQQNIKLQCNILYLSAMSTGYLDGWLPCHWIIWSNDSGTIGPSTERDGLAHGITGGNISIQNMVMVMIVAL